MDNIGVPAQKLFGWKHDATLREHINHVLQFDAPSQGHSIYRNAWMYVAATRTDFDTKLLRTLPFHRLYSIVSKHDCAHRG